MSDEVPHEWNVRQSLLLRKRLLETILTDVLNAGFNCLSNDIGRNCFCYSNEFDCGGIAAAPRGRIMDSIENAKVIRSNIDHRTFLDRAGFSLRPSAAATVSSTAGVFVDLAFFVSVRLCLRISIKSTTFVGAGPFVGGACGVTPAIFIWIMPRTLS